MSEDKVQQIMENLNSNKASGLDEVPSRFIKDRAKYITNPMTYIVYLSILTINIPEDLKIQRLYI